MQKKTTFYSWFLAVSLMKMFFMIFMVFIILEQIFSWYSSTANIIYHTTQLENMKQKFSIIVQILVFIFSGMFLQC